MCATNEVSVGVLGVVDVLELGGWNVVEVAVEPLGVVPVHPPGTCHLDLPEGKG